MNKQSLNDNVRKPIDILTKDEKLYFTPDYISFVVENIVNLKKEGNVESYLAFIENTLADASEEYTLAQENISSLPLATQLEVICNENTISCEVTSFFSRLYNDIGKTYLHLEKVEKAEFYFGNSLDYNEENLNTLYNIADLKFLTTRFEEAIEDCEKILEKEKNHVAATYLIALSYSSMGKPEVALDYFKKTVELDPNSMGANYWTGECLLHKAQLKEALPYFKKSYELSEHKHKESARGYAICELVEGDSQISLDIAEEILASEHGGSQIIALQIKGDALIDLDRIEEGALCHAYLGTIELDARDFIVGRVHKIAKEFGREKARIYAGIILQEIPELHGSFEFLNEENLIKKA